MKVVFLTKLLTHYRVPFHEAVRTKLAAHGVDYELVYGANTSHAEASRADLAELDWGKKRPVCEVTLGGINLVWQTGLRDALSADLVILGQENRLLVNYLLQPLRRFIRPKVALWGHGRNYQSTSPRGVRERWKRLWALRADWWFAYTARTKAELVRMRFPASRVTVFNNSIDTKDLLCVIADVDPNRINAMKRSEGVVGNNLCVFVGGLYPEKRLNYLIDACDLVVRAVPDFELVVVGGGQELPKLKQLQVSRPWLFVVGPKFGLEKAVYMKASKLFLMPGLVGLAILDAGCASLPVVTTAYPFHSPEIEYLVDGVNGVIVRDWRSTTAYATAVIALLRQPERREPMAVAARALVDQYSLDEMTNCFVDGVLEALGRRE